ncbi:MAG: protein BatD [Gammaproteobacteria bacterium]|nr:MAG: protein BatD [Gammaproteobacteria bacterium]
MANFIKNVNMRSIRRILTPVFFIINILLSAYAFADQLTASVDRDTISIQDTFTLTVSADSRVSSKPDFSSLQHDFEILSNNESQYTSISNNGTEFKKIWQLTLAPKREGSLLIPSFTVDKTVSDAIEIKVTKQSQTSPSGDDPVRVAMELSKNTVYVQEQIHLKIQIVSKVNLSQTQMQPLELKNAIVIPLEDKPKQFISVINGRQHLIEEQNFAIFPQESGELVIPSLIYSVVPSAERDLWNDPFGRSRSNVLRLPTEEQRITVKPVPTEAAGKSWLPANNLSINETWSASLDRLKMGEPVTRTITISADGLTGGQIPPLATAATDGLTFYPDQPQNTDKKTTKGIEGTRVETTAIIPNHGGEFTLPEVKLEWWDVNEQVMKTASLPAKTINVIGDAKSDASLAPSAPANQAQVTSEPDVTVVGTEKLNPWLLAGSIIFGVLSLILGVYALSLRSRLKVLENRVDDAHEIISEKEKHIWDLLKHAAANKDAPALRKNVLSWARFQWPDASIHALDDVAKLGGKIELTQALKKLDELLYSNHPSDDWQPNQLLQLLNECRKERNVKKKSEGLKPLYTD